MWYSLEMSEEYLRVLEILHSKTLRQSDQLVVQHLVNNQILSFVIQLKVLFTCFQSQS